MITLLCNELNGGPPRGRRAEPASRGKGVITAVAQTKRLCGRPGAFGFGGFRVNVSY